MSALTDLRSHALAMAGTSTTPAKEAAELLQLADFMGALDTMFEVAPRDWWQFVPCATCNARRRENCQMWNGNARVRHVGRYRSGLVLHGTLWLLRQYPQDVVGEVGD